MVKLLSWGFSDPAGSSQWRERPSACKAGGPAVRAGARTDMTRYIVNWLYAQSANGPGYLRQRTRPARNAALSEAVGPCRHPGMWWLAQHYKRGGRRLCGIGFRARRPALG